MDGFRIPLGEWVETGVDWMISVTMTAAMAGICMNGSLTGTCTASVSDAATVSR